MKKLVILSIILSLVLCVPDPIRFKNYLVTNRAPQCPFRHDQARLPLSFYVPPGYFESVPENQRVAPDQKYTVAETVLPCGNILVQPAQLNTYTFQTEKFLANSGLNIYDGACWSLGMALLGDTTPVDMYMNSVLRVGSTCQFQSVKADNICRGQISLNQCVDKNQSGYCGFCYGDSGDRNLKRINAFFFRMISDMYSRPEPDARCPNKGIQWGWNDYKPVLGENAWANLIAPLQTAFLKYKSINQIPQNAVELSFAMDFFPSLQKMFVPKVHAFYYAPHNTYSFDGLAEFQVATENNMSLMAGLKMLLAILRSLNIHPIEQQQIQSMITELLTYVRSSYIPSRGYFSQGGLYFNRNQTWQWVKEPYFAADCQTWTLAVIGPKQVDDWFGYGTALKIWEKTKEISGYKYDANTKQVDGIGFTENSQQVFSGEWTFGAINMVRVLAQYYGGSTANSLNQEADRMRNAIEREITIRGSIAGVDCPGVLYANKRYYIPFGWWANPVISTASTGWAIAVDKNFNPFNLGGSYKV